MSAATSLTLAHLRRAKEVMARNRAPAFDKAFITAAEWSALGGRPDIWDRLDEIDGLPNHRLLSKPYPND